MMQKKASWSLQEVDAYNLKSIRATKIKQIYEELSGETFEFEVFCTSDNDLCNQRRKSDSNQNHKHPAKIDPPTATDPSSFEEAIELRKQCQKLGLNPSTGIVTDIIERCNIYRMRIANHFEALQKASEAKDRNENRIIMHKYEKKMVQTFSKDMICHQCIYFIIILLYYSYY